MPNYDEQFEISESGVYPDQMEDEQSFLTEIDEDWFNLVDELEEI